MALGFVFMLDFCATVLTIILDLLCGLVLVVHLVDFYENSMKV